MMGRDTYPPTGSRPRTPRVPRILPKDESEFGRSDDHDERIRTNAIEWRLIHYLGHGATYQMTTDNFEWLFAMAKLLKERHQRVLVEAVSKEGRFVEVPERRWAEFYERWLRHEAHKVTVTTQSARSRSIEKEGARQTRKRR